MLRTLWDDEVGVIISAELVLVLTITVLAMVVGLHALSKVVVQELNDLAQAFGTVNQSYSYDGLQVRKGNGLHAYAAGSGFKDQADNCDCSSITLVGPDLKVDSSGGGPEAGGGGGHHGGHGGNRW